MDFNKLFVKRHYTIKLYCPNYDLSQWESFTEEQKEDCLSKKWMIRWWYRNPATGLKERQFNIKAGINRLPTKEDRFDFFNSYARGMVENFKEGLNPYTVKKQPKRKEVIPANEAILSALERKSTTIGLRAYSGYKSHLNAFIEYLDKQGKAHKDIKSIDRLDVSDFLDEQLKKMSARSRNNTRASLSAIFGDLRDKFIIDTNFIDTDIKKLKVKSKTDRRFTLDQVRSISNYLRANDKHLLLYIKIVSYNFLRPIEVNRLKVGSIDLESQTMYFDQKTKQGKTKYISSLYIEDLKELLKDNPPKDYYLFTPDNKPGLWITKDEDKRNYFTKRFGKIRKILDIKGSYGIYSFRHFYISMAYMSLRRKGMSQLEAINHLMVITGHDSESGITKYIHEQDMERPEDWSDLIDFKL